MQFVVRLVTSCGFLRLLADMILNFLRIKCNLTSFCRLRVLAVQELLAPLLARALFLGCTVWFNFVLSLGLKYSITDARELGVGHGQFHSGINELVK